MRVSSGRATSGKDEATYRQDRASPEIGFTIGGTLVVTEATVREIVPTGGIVQFPLASLSLQLRARHGERDSSRISGAMWGDFALIRS